MVQLSNVLFSHENTGYCVNDFIMLSEVVEERATIERHIETVNRHRPLDYICSFSILIDILPKQNVHLAELVVQAACFFNTKTQHLVFVELPLIVIIVDVFQLSTVGNPERINILHNILLLDGYVVLQIIEIVSIQEVVHLVVHPFYHVVSNG